MLVFAGVVKKCLQHGHSFRLAGVWLNSENVRFFRLRVASILLFKGPNRNIRNLWFSIIRIIPGRHSLLQFFPLLDASVPERLWQCRSHRLQQGSAVTSCPAVCFFLWSIDRGRHFLRCFHVPSICWVPATMVLYGSIRFTPQTTSKMISLSKIFCLWLTWAILNLLWWWSLVQLAAKPLAPPAVTTQKRVRKHVQHVNNVYMFRNIREVLVKGVNTPPPPPWWSYDSMRNVYMFCNVREVLVKDVNTSPHPHPPDDHTTACATC